MELKDKRVIITGGTHGIGEATALLFKENGADVLVIGRNGEKGNAMENARGNGKINFYKCDLTVRSDIEKLCEFIDKADKPYDVLINCASRNSRYNILNIELNEWENMVELNLTAVLLMTKHFSNKLVSKNMPGKIINVGAVQSISPLKSSLAYAAVKGALRSITKSLAVDLGEHNILCTLVMPGPIYAKTDSEEPPHNLDSRAATLLQRMGRKAEVANLLKFLASDENSFMTGNEIIIDGGRLISRKSDPDEIMKGDL